MTAHFGMVRPGSILYIPFDTYAGSTGASVTLTGLAVTDIEVYRNGSVTQRASDTGYTLLDTDGIDFDGITGIHGFSIDLSSNATADFFTAGAFYWVVVSAVTIDSQTVNFTAATFQIGYPDAVLNTTIATLSTQTSFTLTAGPAEDDALNGCIIVIHDIASAVQLGYALITDYTGSTRTVTLAAGTTFTAAAGDNFSCFKPALLPTVAGRTLDVSTGGEAGLDWANIGSPTTAQNLSATNIDVDQVVASVSGAVGSVTGAVGSVTGNVGGNVTGSVGSIATGGIAAASFAAGAIDNAAIATDAIGSAELAASAIAEIQSGLSTLDAAGVRAAVGLASADLDTQLAALPTAAENADAVWDEDATGHQTQGTFGQAIGDPVADSDTIWGLVNTNLNATVGSRASQTTADAIEADTQDIQTRLPAALVSGRIDASVGAMAADTITSSALAASASGEIADAVWDETLSGHLGAGSTGEALNAAGAAGDPWTTALPGAYGAGSAGNIIGNNLNATVSSRATQTSVDTIDDLVDDLETRIGTPSNLGSGATVAANLADIEAQTDDIGTAGAGLTALGDTRLANLDAAISTRATPAQVNTEVDTALADVNLDHLVGTATGIPSVPAGTYLDQMMDDGTATYDRTTDSLQAIRDRGDAAWDTADVSGLATSAALSTLSTTIGTPAGASVSADIAAIEAQTDDIGVAGAGLTALASAANLSTLSGLVDDLETRLTATRAGYLDNLSGGAVALQSSVDSLEAGVIVTTNNDKTGYALSAGGVDAILDEPIPEAGVFAWPGTLRTILAWMGALIRNKRLTTSSTDVVRNDADSAALGTASVSDDGTTLTRGEYS